MNNPSGPESGSYRVIRGGSWNLGADDCRSACRDGGRPSYRGGDLGFRLARTGPWRSYPITLGTAQPEPREEAPPPPSDDDAGVARREEPSASPRSEASFKPQETFRDRFVIVAKDGTRRDVEAPEMVYLPGGTFRMGDEQGESDAKPVHRVRLDAFALGRTPVTWGEYRGFCEATDSHWPEWLEKGSSYHLDSGSDKYYPNRGVARDALDLPVVGISWDDAGAYCEWLSKLTGQEYRLPTEAQWEYACRAGTATRWSFGDDVAALDEHAWYSANANGKLHPVAQRRPNSWGFYDLHGNVWEWCGDWYAADYYEQLSYALEQRSSSARKSASGDAKGASSADMSASENPSGPESGSDRVIRGGSWDYGDGLCRSAVRDVRPPSFRDDDLGFRLARTGPPEPNHEPMLGLCDVLQGGGEGPSMIWLPGGIFAMGQDDSPYDDEKPAHPVLVDAFFIGQYPVTIGQYLRFCEDTGDHWPEWLEEDSKYHLEKGSDDYYRSRGVSREAEDLPVVGISWEDASAYCAWLSERTGETYTLPTEAQWEYACRSGSTTRYCFGDNERDLGECAWFTENAEGRLQPVGKKRPNDWGLHDMHGNVWEWCADWYAEDYYTQTKQNATEPPSGPESGSDRVIRGGSWYDDADDCRSAFRLFKRPSDRFDDLGFRLARTL